MELDRPQASPFRWNWAVPFLIVSVSAILQGYVSHSILQSISGVLAPALARMLSDLQWIATVGSGFALWVVVSGIVHISAQLMDGRGGYRPLAFLWGYGYIPQVATGVITYLVFQDLLPTISEFMLENPMNATELTASFPILRSVRLANEVAQYMTYAWGVWCVQRVHKLPWWKSAAAVAIPVALMLGLRLLFAA